MNSRKKKPPGQAGPGNQPTAGPAVIPKRIDPRSKPGPLKDARGKAPRIYSLSNTGPGSSRSHDKSILKVSIPAALEKKVLKLINDFRHENKDDVSVSCRLTSKKLLDLYTALERFKFKREHIEEAMKKTIVYGGDLYSALDWLCLNLKDEELPDGFSQQLEEEIVKMRPKQQPPALLERAVRTQILSTSEEHVTVNKEDDEFREMDWIACFSEQGEEDAMAEETAAAATAAAAQEAAAAEPEARTGKRKKKKKTTTSPPKSPEICAELDPNDKYLILAMRLQVTRDRATNDKMKGDSMRQRVMQEEIRTLQGEMKELEMHPLFSSSSKEYTVALKERKALLMSDAKEDLTFASFKEEDFKPPVERAARSYRSMEIRNFAYTLRNWTGKSPKQFLIDWVRRNLPRSPPPTFIKVPEGKYWRCKVRVLRTDFLMEVCPTILTRDSMQAQHLGATLALYNMVKGQSVHQLLPPPYRDVWLEWKDSEEQKEEETRLVANKPRDKFIGGLMNRLKKTILRNVPPVEEPPPAPPPEPPPTEESWEDLAELSLDEDDQSEGNERSIEDEELEEAKRLYLNLRKSSQAKKLQEEREQLPVYEQRDRILELLRRHQVVMIAAETGSGKSTQIPQFLLEEMLVGEEFPRPCNIVVTQPRRLSTVSLGHRVNEELGCPEEPGSESSLCGYQIRMENKSGERTRLLYCTTGVLLRKLQNDKTLSSVTHIIVDEVHERSVQSDFLLTILKDLITKRSDLSLILMSATMDCDKFSNYFHLCPVVSIRGRSFPVEVYHLEDVVEMTGYVLEKDSEYNKPDEDKESYAIQRRGRIYPAQDLKPKDNSELNASLSHLSKRTRFAIQHMNPHKINMDLLMELLGFLDKSPQFADSKGAILIFLPGLMHIEQLHDILSLDRRFNDKARYQIIPLHSLITPTNQASAFTLPPAGIRKIILSTNIAETGITIPDVVFVIDSGKIKENKYHESSQMSSLVEMFTSKASALQRQGRAGRVGQGFCFRLYSKARFEELMDYAVPEMLRVPLEELCLHVMKCQYGAPEDFLNRAMDAPLQQSISNAINLLRKIGACQPLSHTLTPLGVHLAGLPVNVRIGKMLVYGAILGCLEPIAVISAGIAEKNPFVTPIIRREDARIAKLALSVPDSDHLSIYTAYVGWRKAKAESVQAEIAYCRQNFLSRSAFTTIEKVKQELIKMMEQAGFCPSAYALIHQQVAYPSQEQISLMKAALTAGLYDNVARVIRLPVTDVLQRTACWVDTPQGRAQVHPTSVNCGLQAYGWLLYQEKVRYSKIYVRDTTLVSPFALLLFGGEIDVQHREKLIFLDCWIHFQAPVRIGVIFKQLRRMLESVLQKKLLNPSLDLQDEPTIQLILEMIRTEGKM